MHTSQDIGVVRRELVRQAFAEQRARHADTPSSAMNGGQLRQLLDEAHARIRNLEKAIATLTAAL